MEIENNTMDDKLYSILMSHQKAIAKMHKALENTIHTVKLLQAQLNMLTIAETKDLLKKQE